MQVLSLTEARNNMKAMFESVFRDNEEVIIHRKGREIPLKATVIQKFQKWR